MWIAIKRVLPQVVCFRSFGNLIGAPPSGGGGGAIRSSTRIQNPKIRVPGWPLHWHLSNGPLSKPTAIQTLLESGLEQTVDPPGRESIHFPQTCCKDTLPTNVRRWESLDPRVGDPPGFQHSNSGSPDRDRTGGELPRILSLSINFQPSESGRKAGLSMNGRPPT